MGTRFLSAEECSIHPVYKERILKSQRPVHHGHRQAPGASRAQPADQLSPGTTPKPSTAAWTTRPWRPWSSGALRKAVVEGDLEEGCFLSARWPPW
ncbi:MAG: hypothetical protein ACLR1T_13665 [Evtepia gabavorous]